MYDEVSSTLEGFDWQEFSGVEANPSYETLCKAVKLAKSEKIDFILAIEKMYQSIGVATNLNDYERVDDKVIENIIPSLKAHGMIAIGENQNITLDVSEKILKMAMQ